MKKATFLLLIVTLPLLLESLLEHPTISIPKTKVIVEDLLRFRQKKLKFPSKVVIL